MARSSTTSRIAPVLTARGIRCTVRANCRPLTCSRRVRGDLSCAALPKSSRIWEEPASRNTICATSKRLTDWMILGTTASRSASLRSASTDLTFV